MGSWLASAAADAHNRRAIRPALTTAGKLARALLLVVNHICIRVIRGQILLLLFIAQFLESGIAAQRVPDRIET
jgi:hypothetical protein